MSLAHISKINYKTQQLASIKWIDAKKLIIQAIHHSVHILSSNYHAFFYGLEGDYKQYLQEDGSLFNCVVCKRINRLPRNARNLHKWAKELSSSPKSLSPNLSYHQFEWYQHDCIDTIDHPQKYVKLEGCNLMEPKRFSQRKMPPRMLAYNPNFAS